MGLEPIVLWLQQWAFNSSIYIYNIMYMCVCVHLHFFNICVRLAIRLICYAVPSTVPLSGSIQFNCPEKNYDPRGLHPQLFPKCRFCGDIFVHLSTGPLVYTRSFSRSPELMHQLALSLWRQVKNYVNKTVQFSE